MKINRKLQFFTLIIIVLILFPVIGHSQGCEETTSDEGAQVVGYIQPEWNRYE